MAMGAEGSFAGGQAAGASAMSSAYGAGDPMVISSGGGGGEIGGLGGEGGGGIMSMLSGLLGDTHEEKAANLKAISGALDGASKMVKSTDPESSTFLERARQIQIAQAARAQQAQAIRFGGAEDIGPALAQAILQNVRY